MTRRTDPRTAPTERSRADKLGVTQDARVLVLGLAGEADFVAELKSRTATMDTDGRRKAYDLIFLRVEHAADLRRLKGLAARIKPAGAIWIVHPRGRRDLAHDVLVSAGRAASLIDNKTARFSDTHTGLRFVIPRSLRRP